MSGRGKTMDGESTLSGDRISRDRPARIYDMQIQVVVLGQAFSKVVCDCLNTSVHAIRVNRVIGQQRNSHSPLV